MKRYVCLAVILLLQGCTEEQAREFAEGYNRGYAQSATIMSADNADMNSTPHYDPTARTRLVQTIEQCSADVGCGYGRMCVRPAEDWRAPGRCIVPVTQAGVPLQVVQSGSMHTTPGCRFDADCHGYGERCVVSSESAQYGICMQAN